LEKSLAKSKSSRKRSRSSSRSTRKGKGASNQAGRIAPTLASWLTPQRKKDLIGLLLIALGIFTIISIFSTRQGLLGSAWLNFLGWSFGWGLYLVPLALIGIGLRLVLRNLTDRMPRLLPEQLLGLGMLAVLLLVVMHALTGARTLDEALAVAGENRGGGALGGVLLALTISGLGAGGSLVLLGAWLLVGLTFTFGISLPEMLAMGGRLWRWLAERLNQLLPPASPQADQVPLHETSERPSAPAIKPGESSQFESAPPAASEQDFQTPETDQTRPVWTMPSLESILEPGDSGRADETFDRERARLIEETLQAFGAPAHVVEINRGPVITQFGVEPDFMQGRGGRRTKVKVSKISALADDLALALAAPSIRIEAPVPGKGFVGIEVPNTEVSLVALRDVMESQRFQRIRSRLRLALGKNVSGGPVAADLAAMPHLLIAGTTGSGKSVCVNAIVSCLLLQNSPEDLKFVMVDPKRVELTTFNGIPHLLAPVVVELERVVPALQWVSREMDRRYHLFATEGVRNIADYNQRSQHIGRAPLHYIVVVIDELADLMMLAPDETERVITRLAQLARATGIHLVIATQRPSVDVVTGLIKANFPSRIAFAVASSVDSRVILDQPGAERLLGRGDMLFQAPDAPAPIRMQGAYVSEAELGRLVRYWITAGLGGEATQPSPSQLEPSPPSGVPLKQAPLWEEGADEDKELDPVFDEAVQIVREMRRASISLLQRRLRIGYTRAARLVDQLEEKGIIGPAQSGSQPREVIDYGDLSASEFDR
jgi:S-DNA-T family DNA segregation ATPase FtsK/SpoIIIE